MQVILNEQSSLLRRITIPAHCIINDDLKENLYVSFVCVQVGLPTVLMGGCSKSMALRLLDLNLKGKQSAS